MGNILEVRDLTVEFDVEGGVVHAVTDVSYTLGEGETLGIVGESGCGKSVHVLSMLGLVPMPPGRIVRGEVLFEGRNLLTLGPEEVRRVRGREIGFVFQDPMTSLNPVLSIGRQLTEGVEQHLGFTPRQSAARATELLDLVHIPSPKSRLRQYPHEFSGGMRQRVMIAMALACEPKLLIADEPTTALDVTIQAQILELVRDLKKRLGMAVIWITHDLGVVAGIADNVQVMYAGRIVERGPVEAVYADPRNAYTFGLLRSLPQGASGQTRLLQIDGAPPSLRELPPGDPFAPRNPYATERCLLEVPPLDQVADGAAGHMVAAWYDLKQSLADGGST
ncbi:MAG: ABC transporter ATP-binding protein [Rhodospirillales bacterium]|jgi:peptide/nickel transport system ATP-binding protein/oligopeptide transport system ATP-binding protein|nr:ABC transporter ATP-binding protein [Rhodospirillales bacterium]HJO97400.1 ABC transporter ATP-binding protein [Rhodospirillales bacterium]